MNGRISYAWQRRSATETATATATATATRVCRQHTNAHRKEDEKAHKHANIFFTHIEQKKHIQTHEEDIEEEKPFASVQPV